MYISITKLRKKIGGKRSLLDSGLTALGHKTQNLKNKNIENTSGHMCCSSSGLPGVSIPPKKLKKKNQWAHV